MVNKKDKFPLWLSILMASFAVVTIALSWGIIVLFLASKLIGR